MPSDNAMDALRSAIQMERKARSEAAARQGKDDEGWRERCYGWTDALDWVLTLMDVPAQTTGTTAVKAGED